jgi:hypothetical protein
MKRLLLCTIGLYSNSGLQITHDVYINVYFMVIIDLKTDRCFSEVHSFHPENSNIMIELKFNKPLPEAITCLLYLELDISFLVDFSRTFTTGF